MIAMPILIALCGAVSMFLIVLSLLPRRHPMAARIEQMQAVSEPVYATRLQRFEAIVAGESRGRLQARLYEGGWYRTTPAAYTLRVFAGMFLGVCVGALLFGMLPSKSLAILAGALAALVGSRFPKIALDRAIKERKTAIERALPDFLDLLSSTVQAGLALNGAMINAADAATGPLKEELSSALAEIRLGRSRADALESMASRVNEPQVTTMTTAILQAEMLGSNVSAVLHELAIDTRHRRWSSAEERASKLPVTMLLPMALLMMPSLYIMIFGPVLASVIASGSLSGVLGAVHKAP